MTRRNLKKGAVPFAVAGVALWSLCALVLVPGIASAAIGTHVFDPTLSLTGGCTTSELDPIEDPSCPDEPPSAPFARPWSVATDFYGNIYVSVFGKASDGSEGRIDIFDPEGRLITELPEPQGPLTIAVDSVGTLYVVQGTLPVLVRYSPSTYQPARAEIAYSSTPVPLVEQAAGLVGISVNVLNDHLLANFGTRVGEFSSAADDNEPLADPVTDFRIANSVGIALAVDAQHGLIYAGDENNNIIRSFELSEPHALVRTIQGADVPGGKFVGPLAVAVDEGTGHVFVHDQEANKVYEFDAAGKYISTIEHGFRSMAGSELGVDNGPYSPNGALNPDGRYLFVPSHPSGVGHVFAFGPAPAVRPPSVESVGFANVTSNEAELRASINPGNLETTYAFEYTSQASFEASGWSGASTAGGGHLPAGGVVMDVSAVVVGLTPETTYRFRVRATNEVSGEAPSESEASFRTYPSSSISPCTNDLERAGISKLLPDCRAYELVTPADTNGRSPRIGQLGTYFPTSLVSADGAKLSFQIEGGALPGTQATGSLAGDPYVASRGAPGWITAYRGPTPTEAPDILPGNASPDQEYLFWSTAGGRGTAAVEGASTSYVRYPDGHSALVGRGRLGIDPRATGRLISEGGTHVVFDTGSNSSSARQLEPDAAPDGTRAIYDRTGDEVTHVVSLLPGDIPLSSGENAIYQGASPDGRGIAFLVNGTLYLRYEDSETFKVGEGATFAGLAEGGSRIFYMEGGQLWRFDALAGTKTAFNSSGIAVPVNVSGDGSSAYFVSTSVLTTKANPSGAKAKAGQRNLYLSREGLVSFVGTVTERDVIGEFARGIEWIDGLGLWTAAVGRRQAEVPARTSSDGSVLLFQSRAPLTGYDPEGHTEVYRYDSTAGTLQCLSCNPTGAAAGGDATLQSLGLAMGDPQPLTSSVRVANLRGDGRRAFFQSTEALVPSDTDKLQDVYEWEAAGVGSCTHSDGCVFLISSGHSSRTDYLYAVSQSGDDAFFTSSDLLSPFDSDETPSIYDARVGGGFVATRSPACEGEACQRALPPAPGLAVPQTSPTENTKGHRRPCPRGKRLVKRHERSRCVKKHRRHRHRKANPKEKGAVK